MVGHKYLKPELIDLNFWAKMPIKFQAIRMYDKHLVSPKLNALNEIKN